MEELLELPGRRAGWCTELWIDLWAGRGVARWAGLRAAWLAAWRAGRRAGRGEIRPAAHRTTAYWTQPGDTTFGTECASHGATLRAALRALRRAALRTGRRAGRLQDARRAGPCAGLWAGPCAGRRAVRLAGLRWSSIPAALSPPADPLAKQGTPLDLRPLSGRGD